MRASSGQFDQEEFGGCQIGIACGDKRYESAASGTLQLDERVAYPTHFDCKSAMSWTSLSPRPDKLTMIESCCDRSLATRMAGRIACELSSAGMIPSNFAQSRNPSSASASLARTYSAR